MIKNEENSKHGEPVLSVDHSDIWPQANLAFLHALQSE